MRCRQVYSAVAVQVFMVTVFLTLTLEILKAQEPKFFAQESSKKKVTSDSTIPLQPVLPRKRRCDPIFD